MSHVLWQMIMLALVTMPLIVYLRWLERAWVAVLGAKVNWISGWIGVVCHEASHAIMCVVFRHHIDKIVFFQPSGEGGKLGYVAHRYNPRSYYQQVGNLFIGIAPLFGNIAVANAILYYIDSQPDSLTPWEHIGLLAAGWYAVTCLLIHAAPSRADLVGYAKGVIFLAILAMTAALWMPEAIAKWSDVALHWLLMFQWEVAVMTVPCWAILAVFWALTRIRQ